MAVAVWSGLEVVRTLARRSPHRRRAGGASSPKWGRARTTVGGLGGIRGFRQTGAGAQSLLLSASRGLIRDLTRGGVHHVLRSGHRSRDRDPHGRRRHLNHHGFGEPLGD